VAIASLSPKVFSLFNGRAEGSGGCWGMGDRSQDQEGGGMVMGLGPRGSSGIPAQPNHHTTTHRVQGGSSQTYWKNGFSRADALWKKSWPEMGPRPASPDAPALVDKGSKGRRVDHDVDLFSTSVGSISGP